MCRILSASRLITMRLFWLLLMFCEVFSDFYAGRIKPGKFEYPKINGLMSVNDAQRECENDLSCAGFTFKGSYKTLNRTMQMYFFHFIPENNDVKYLYWSTYKVDRNYVKLTGITVKSNFEYSVGYANLRFLTSSLLDER